MFEEPADMGGHFGGMRGACTIGYLSLTVTFDDERIVGLADSCLAQDLSARR